jgi:hypothetical protein
MTTNYRKINKVINPDYNLQKCDDLINRWSKELMTVFSGECKKDWKPGQHLIVKKDKWDTTRIMVFSTNNALVNSAVELVSYTATTIIAWSNRDRLYFTFYGNRQSPTKYCYFEKIDNKSFLSCNGEGEKVLNYRDFQTESGRTLNENECFNNTGLYGQMIKFYKNDISIKRRGGQARSAKKTAANKAHGFQPTFMCKLDFENSHGWVQDTKSILDSYRIAAGKYGYKKFFSSFKNDIKKGELRLDIGKSVLSVNLLPAKAVGFTQPTININIETCQNLKENKKVLNLEGSSFIVGEVNLTQEQSSKDNILKQDWSMNNVPYCNHYRKYGGCPAVKKIKALIKLNKLLKKSGITKIENDNTSILKEYEIYTKGCPEGYALSIEEWYSYSNK